MAKIEAQDGIEVTIHGSAVSDVPGKTGMRDAERRATARPKQAPAAMETTRWFT